MNFDNFVEIFSYPRVNRYLLSVGGDKRKAQTLYRKNLKLSQEMFTIISCFEIALRNRIDNHYTAIYGNNWLYKSINKDGIFDTPQTQRTKKIIWGMKEKLGDNYTHPKLIAELDFGVWRNLFASPQFVAGGQNLLKIFPSKPKSSVSIQYNHTYIFNELAKINILRNRIAHHEPICFSANSISTQYVRENYNLILQFFNWMNINSSDLLYGLDHIQKVCDEIDDI